MFLRKRRMAKTQVDVASHLALAEAPCWEGEARRHPKHDRLYPFSILFFPREGEKSSPMKRGQTMKGQKSLHGGIFGARALTISKMQKAAK